MNEAPTTGLPRVPAYAGSIGVLIEDFHRRGVQLWFEGDRLRFRAPKGALDAASQAALSGQKDAIVAALRAAAASEETIIPATAGQQMHWFNRQADPDSAAYNVGQAVRISSTVDVAALRSALQVVVDRHAALRSTFAWDDEGPIQKIAGWKPIAFQHRDVRGVDEEGLHQAVAAAARETFDLNAGPVFRATLHTRADDDHVLTIIGHHIVFDGGSIFKVLTELRALYAEATGGEQARLPRPSSDPAAFASWHRDLLAGPDGARMEAYWAEALAGLGTQVVLTGDRPHGSAPVDQDLVRSAIPSDLVEAVRRASAAGSVTPFVLYLAAYQAVLHRWTGADDVIVGTPAFFGRADSRFTDAVGDFVNVLPLRARLTNAITLRDLVEQARSSLYGAFDAQALPFTRIVEIVQPARVAGRAPLVSATLTLQRFDELRELQGLFAPAEGESRFDFAGLEMSIYPLNWLPNAFDLQLQLMQVGDSLQVYWGFDAAVFDRVTVEEFNSDYLDALSTIVTAPETQVAELETSRVAEAAADGFAESQAFWRRTLAGAPALVDLPCDRPRPPGGSVRRARTRGYFDEALIDRLEQTAGEHDCTLFIALVAAWQALLSRLSGQDDVVVGTTTAHRDNSEFEEAVGHSVNIVPLRGDLAGSPSFVDLLARTKLAVSSAFEHSSLPFEALVEAVNPERAVAYAPIFQVLLTLCNSPMQATGPGATSSGPIEVDVHAARFDLALDLTRVPFGPGEGQMIAAYEFASDLFDEQTVLRWHEQFKLVLEAACANPARPLAEVPLMQPDEARAFYASRNDTALEHDRSFATHALLDAAARRNPDQVAIVGPDGQLTYAEFEERTNQLANQLVALGVKPGSRVAVCLERGIDLPVALAGAWKAGAAYVPLDPAHPSQRLGYVLEDAEVACAVTTSALAPLFSGVAVPLLQLDVDGNSIAAAPATLPSVTVAPDDLAYVIYTSGSTGRPKGVEIEHRNLVAFLAAMQRTPGLAAGESLLAVTTPSFDIAGLEFWLPLSVGGRVAIASRQDTLDGKRLAGLLEQHAVSMMQATPATWRLMLESGWEGKADLTALCGGEAMPLDLARSLAPRVAALWNMYGPTETTIWSTIYRVRGDEVAIPIGGPIANTRIYVLDTSGKPSPIGAPGELVITGEGVTRGYRNRPELNAEKFVEVAPLGASERAFRTGDLARWRSDGQLDFLGRGDGQVKIRGFRIELGEIEARLADLQAVASAVVAAREDSPGEKRLVAYVVTAPGAKFDESETRAALRKTLPDYMVPGVYVELSRLPLSPNGKVDRKALPAPSVSADTAPDPADALMTPAQQRVAALWRKVLRLDRVGLNQNFFDLGGHSLLLVKLQVSLKASMGQEIAIVELFQRTTVAAQAELVAGPIAEAEAAAALLERLAERDIHCSIDGDKLRINAPKGALDDAIKAEISANRDALLVALRLRAEREADRGGIPALPSGRAPELSFAQRRLWFLDQMDPGSVRYNIGGGVRLTGALDAGVLRAALEDVFARHEAFRTKIGTENGAPKVEILAPSLVPIEVLDLSSTSESQRDAVARDTATSLMAAPLDLAAGVPARACIIRFAPEDHVFVLSVHHIVSDGWSLSIIHRDVRLAYDARMAGGELKADAPKVRYTDFAAWEQDRAKANGFAESQAFWRRALAGAPALIDLPCDRPRPPGGSVRGARTRAYFDEDLIEGLEKTARAHGCTLFIGFLALWQALLSRLSGQEDVVIGTTVANRGNAALEEMVGFLVNNVPLRGDLTGSPSFADLLARTKLAVFGAFEHSALPFEALVEAVNPERTVAHAPVFQTLLTLMNFPMEATGPGGTALDPIELEVHAARFDLALDLVRLPIGPRAGQMVAAYEYAADLFDESTVLRWHDQFRLLLEAACANPNRPLAEIPLMQAPEARAFYSMRNDTALEHDRSLATHVLLDAAARGAPQQVAIVGPDGELTYAEFEARSNQLANVLVARGVKPGSRVAVCLERGIDLPVALAAAWKAGAAYVPLDPAHPSQRLGYVLEDADVSCAVTTSALASLFDGVPVPLLQLDVDDKAIVEAATTLPGPHVAPDDLAYVIYTSGSTGRPKGVEIEHRNLVAFLAAMKETPGLRAGETLLAVTTPSFDIAGLELWLPLSVGGKVVIASRQDTLDGKRLARLLEDHAVSMLQATPATWRLMLESGWEGKADLTALCGGEAMPLDLARSLTPRVAALWNMYGPTETTIWSMIYRVKGDEGAIPIGGPIANTRIYILDASGTPSPIGAPGELVITGEGVARGYRNRPELNAEKFVQVAPLGTPEPAFRTGDLARWRSDGEIDFLGRGDGQVKIRGFRIELGEIEARLAALPAVASAVVAAREDTPGEKRLVAYVVTAPGTEFDEAETRAALRKTLPDYMAPSAYVQLNRLPLSPNGKVDRKALPAPSASGGAAPDPADALMTPMQRDVAALWREVLRLDRVGLNQNFFDLGGHSLLLVKLQASLKESFGQEIAIVELFQRTTVAAQAERLASPVRADDALERARAKARRTIRG